MVTSVASSRTAQWALQQGRNQYQWPPAGPRLPWEIQQARSGNSSQQGVLPAKPTAVTGRILPNLRIPSRVSSAPDAPLPPVPPKPTQVVPEVRPSVPPIPSIFDKNPRSRAVPSRGVEDQRLSPSSVQATPQSHGSEEVREAPPALKLQVPSPSAQRKSLRLSQFVDTSSGRVHRRQLSDCLREILDSKFEVPHLPAHTIDIDLKFRVESDHKIRENSQPAIVRMSKQNDLVDRRSIQPASALHQQKQVDTSQVYHVSKCQCPAGSVICYCQSSEEFEHFRQSYRQHKTNPSVSSTVCMLSIPRARFSKPAEKGYDVHDSQSSKTADSLAGFSFSTGATRMFTTDFGQWPMPPSTSSQKSQDSQISKPNRDGKNRSVDPRLASFSRPFRPESGGKPPHYYHSPKSSSSSGSEDSPVTPTAPTRLPLPIPGRAAKMTRLASVSTLSTFHFDFNSETFTTDTDAPPVPQLEAVAPQQKRQKLSVSRPFSKPYGLAGEYDLTYLQALDEQFNFPDDDSVDIIDFSNDLQVVQLATATTKSVVAMSRSPSDVQLEEAERLILSPTPLFGKNTSKRPQVAPLFLRPKLVNLNS